MKFNTNTAIGFIYRCAVVEFIRVVGVERFALYCIKKLDKFITNISNIYKSLTKH